MWQRQRRRGSKFARSSARQRVAATYAVVGLAIAMLWLLPLPTAAALSSQVVALIVAFVAVHLALRLHARRHGWRIASASLFRQAAAREMAHRGHGRVVLVDGIVGWGWPVGLFVVAADSLGRGGLFNVALDAALLQFVVWSVAGAAVGQFLWSLSDDPAIEEPTPSRMEPVLTPSRPPTPANDAPNTAADLLLSSRA